MSACDYMRSRIGMKLKRVRTDLAFGQRGLNVPIPFALSEWSYVTHL